MRRGIGIAGVLAAMVLGTGTAQAGTVLRVDDGRAAAVRDPLLPPASETRLPETARPRTLIGPPPPATPLAEPAPSAVDGALTAARAARDALPAGPSRDELAGVIANAEALIASGQLTPSREPATLMTLRRNTEFWAANEPPAPGTRVTFTGSPVILEFYPGEGLQIQPLASFGKANAAWRSCKATANPHLHLAADPCSTR